MFLLLFALLAQNPDEWSTFPAQPPAQQQAAPQTQGPIPDAALPRYREAVAHVTGGRYPQAMALLNQLALENPRVAEIFATRCSALLGQKQPQYAETDCAYALSIKPQLSMAMYGLATAEETQGKRASAAVHYRQFEADPSARSDLRAEASRRASALTASDANAAV